MAQNNYSLERAEFFFRVLRQCPSAVANIRGSEEYPAIKGTVYFYQTAVGVLVSVQVCGLPAVDAPCKESVFALHIHNGGSCTGDQDDPFKNVLSHYNPAGCEHPYHAGDLIPLFGNNGIAFEVLLTNRFSVDEILGKAIIIHLSPDDFTTQPSGNSGRKIACGQIERFVSHNC